MFPVVFKYWSDRLHVILLRTKISLKILFKTRLLNLFFITEQISLYFLENYGVISGQRSLVALSLVLAMLKFKPAPIYILDEVDAALDLSHTQNIGAMIKTHFKESQVYQ